MVLTLCCKILPYIHLSYDVSLFPKYLLTITSCCVLFSAYKESVSARCIMKTSILGPRHTSSSQIKPSISANKSSLKATAERAQKKQEHRFTLNKLGEKKRWGGKNTVILIMEYFLFVCFVSAADDVNVLGHQSHLLQSCYPSCGHLIICIYDFSLLFLFALLCISVPKS